jgi:hypothetical protein
MRLLIYTEESADERAVVTRLHKLGASTVIPPQPELPNVAVAEVAEPLAATLFDRIRAIPGVRDVEPDAWSGTF